MDFPLLLAAEPATVVFLVGLAISIGLGVAAAVLANKQKGKRDPNVPPPTTVLQGGYVPKALGLNRLAPIVGAVGFRIVTSSRQGSGKNKGPREYKFSESGWHMLCVGPAYKLHRIWVNGTLFWEGPIDRESDPSGSFISIGGNVPGFYIYWGEEDQPINNLDETGQVLNLTELIASQQAGYVPGAVDHTTRGSRFPFVCYVYWPNFGLQTDPIWPQIEYEVEVRLLEDYALDRVPSIEFDGADGVTSSAANEAADKFVATPNKGIHSGGVTFPFWGHMRVYRPRNSASPAQGGAGVIWTTRSTYPAAIQGFKVGFTATTAFADALPTSGSSVTASVACGVVNDVVDLIFAFDEAGGDITSHIYTSETPAGDTETDTAAFTDPLGDTYIGSFAFFGIPIPYFNTWVESFPYPAAQMENPGRIGPIKIFSGPIPDGTDRQAIFDGEDPEVIAVGNGSTLVEHHPMDEDSLGDDVEGPVGSMDVQGSPTPTDLLEVQGLWIDNGEAQGVNPAHAWWELAMAPYPHGAGGRSAGPFPPGEDIKSHVSEESLLDWATECGEKSLAGSVLIAAGDQAGDTMSMLMQDHGVLLSWRGDEGCGKFIFHRVRQETPLVVPAGMGVSSPPQIETPLREGPFDKIIFTYRSKRRNYKETVILLNKDGQASLLEVQRAIKTPIPTAVDYPTAVQIAERRSQEDLPNNAGAELTLNRNAFMLWPGLVLDITAIDPDVPTPLRVMEVEIDQLSSAVKVRCVADNYGVNTSEFEGDPDQGEGGGGSAQAPAEDLAADFLELPHVLLPARDTQIVVLRIRGNNQIIGANVYLSPDGTSYNFAADLTDTATGGELDEAIEVDAPWYIPEGPEFSVLGVDLSNVEDLSTDEAAWRACRQVVVIGTEIFALQKVTQIDDDTYRLDGLIRARFGTRRQAHAIGDVAYILSLEESTPLEDPVFMAPGETLYVKSQPHAYLQSVDLSDVAASNHVIRGNGVVPARVCALRAVAPVMGNGVYYTGDSPKARWGYISNEVPGTGAGMCLAGAAVGTSPPYGTFEIQIVDSMDDVVATYNVGEATEFEYANADLIDDLGSEVDFTMRVFNINGGFRSEAEELFFEFN